MSVKICKNSSISRIYNIMFIIETKCLSDYSHNNDEKLLSVEINHNPNWSYILDHPYRTLMFGGSRSGKANVLLNLIKNQ